MSCLGAHHLLPAWVGFSVFGSPTRSVEWFSREYRMAPRVPKNCKEFPHSSFLCFNINIQRAVLDALRNHFSSTLCIMANFPVLHFKCGSKTSSAIIHLLYLSSLPFTLGFFPYATLTAISISPHKYSLLYVLLTSLISKRQVTKGKRRCWERPYLCGVSWPVLLRRQTTSRIIYFLGISNRLYYDLFLCLLGVSS